MTGHQDSPSRGDDPTRIFDGAFRLVVVLALLLVVLMTVRVLADAMAPGGAGTPPGAGQAGAVVDNGTSPSPAPSPSADPASFLMADVRPAPSLALTGPDGGGLSLASMRGGPVLVFFGYTHCPDVCPATVGTVGEAIDAYGSDVRAIFVTVDPERDTVAWLAEFVRYMPTGFTAVTGTPPEIRRTADGWDVRYARVEEATPGAYSMAHTADVFLVDADGLLRASFPFGTPATTMTSVLRLVEATPAAPAAPTVAPSVDPGAPTPAPAAPSADPSVSPGATAEMTPLTPLLVSSSVWAGGATPLILALHDAMGRVNDPDLAVTAQLVATDGSAVGPAVDAVAIQPSGLQDVSFVATLDIPTPGAWRIAVTARDGRGAVAGGLLDVTALDPGGSAALGVTAPAIRTQTATDVSGDLTWLTTDPIPEPRLYSTSTADALAAGKPFVFVVDSYRFKVTEVCGTSLFLARQLMYRWTAMTFIHHEPYRFSVVTTEPLLEGTLAEPRLTDVAEAWGVGAPPWGIGSMPWIFIVDGDGVVRAKYQGVVGSADVDVILTLLSRGG